MKRKTISNSVRETQALGKKIAEDMKNGKVAFLSGILGAGKTELVRGIAEGLAVKSRITSPTFNIFRVYDSPAGKFYHFDCYRLKKYSDLQELGWEEILADKKSIVVLEWPECIEDRDITKLSGKKVILLEIEIDNSDRVISVSKK